jgi:hypothetical protein
MQVFSTTDNVFAISSDNPSTCSYVEVWPKEHSKWDPKITTKLAEVLDYAVTDTHLILLLAGKNGIWTVNLGDIEEVVRVPHREQRFDCLSLSPCGRFFAASSSSARKSKLFLFDAASSRMLTDEFEIKNKGIDCLLCSTDMVLFSDRKTWQCIRLIENDLTTSIKTRYFKGI